MNLSIVFPMFWGRKKEQVVQEGDYFYDHPTALDTEGTIPPLFDSLKVLKDREFDIIAVVGANHPSMAPKSRSAPGSCLVNTLHRLKLSSIISATRTCSACMIFCAVWVKKTLSKQFQ
jgi:hypothetical protein